MRHSVMIGLGLALIATAAFAQQSDGYAPKKTYLGGKKPASVAPMTKTPVASTSPAANDLRRIERQSAKAASGRKGSAPKPHPGSAPLLNSKSAPPINAAGGGGMGTAKSSSLTNQGKNPYRGRLHQKGQ